MLKELKDKTENVNICPFSWKENDTRGNSDLNE
jgi:hypothetical protein